MARKSNNAVKNREVTLETTENQVEEKVVEVSQPEPDVEPKAENQVEEKVVEVSQPEPDVEPKAENQVEEKVVEVSQPEPDVEPKAENEVPENVVNLMRLYPQMKSFYVTPQGFVHPANAPLYLIKGATLYQNKFYNN